MLGPGLYLAGISISNTAQYALYAAGICSDLCCCVGLEHELLAVKCQVVEVLQGSCDALNLLVLHKAKALWLLCL